MNKIFETAYDGNFQIKRDDSQLIDNREYRVDGAVRTEQRLLRNDLIRHKQTFVQAFINNIAFPKSLDELEYFIYENGMFNVEDILQYDSTEWTVPHWAKVGDMVFFMHAKYARSTITRLRTELRNSKDRYSLTRYKNINAWLDRGLDLHAKYGGKIYAIGMVNGSPTIYADDGDDILHWKSRLYAAIDYVHVLKNPVDLSEFRDFIRVSRQGAITPVLGDAFDKLRSVIKKQNRIPAYFEHSVSSPIPLTRITNKNWIRLPAEYIRRFMLESQFRSFYVDHLLKEIKDHHTRLYSECRCRKAGIPDSFVDNVMRLKEKYLPVEVKLAVSSEASLKEQVKKYTYDDTIICGEKQLLPDDIYTNKVLIIDTDNVYIYDADSNDISKIYSLDDLHDKSDLVQLRRTVIRKL